MIYYRKTLFGHGPKLTAVHVENYRKKRPHVLRGHEGPALQASVQKGANGKLRVRRISSKMDQVRYDANWLAKVIESNDTALEFWGS